MDTTQPTPEEQKEMIDNRNAVDNAERADLTHFDINEYKKKLKSEVLEIIRRKEDMLAGKIRYNYTRNANNRTSIHNQLKDSDTKGGIGQEL
jgi:hypothetical protein